MSIENMNIEVANLLHRMNLNRPDIAALLEGATISINVTTHRQAAALIKKLQQEVIHSAVDIGEFTLYHRSEGKVTIQHTSGEGGDFSEAALAAAIRQFYKDNF